MKLYLVSFAAGILVGIIYALIQVRSPAPPAIALIGLLGMLVGEQVVPVVKRVISGEPVTISWFRHECVPKISGAPVPDGGPESKSTPVAAKASGGTDGA
jgi:XapX domain-containing protein